MNQLANTETELSGLGVRTPYEYDLTAEPRQVLVSFGQTVFEAAGTHVTYAHVSHPDDIGILSPISLP
jgi:hypothetical protein